jgi:hypothetical protein
MAKSWTASGYDYGTNFTINFCEPVVEPLLNVVGVDRKDWGNVSAYYRLDGDTYSIGYAVRAPPGDLAVRVRLDAGHFANVRTPDRSTRSPSSAAEN